MFTIWNMFTNMLNKFIFLLMTYSCVHTIITFSIGHLMSFLLLLISPFHWGVSANYYFHYNSFSVSATPIQIHSFVLPSIYLHPIMTPPHIHFSLITLISFTLASTIPENTSKCLKLKRLPRVAPQTSPPSLLDLHNEVILEIMKRVAKGSYLSLVNAKVTCITMRNLSQELCMLKHVSLRKSHYLLIMPSHMLSAPWTLHLQ